MKQGLALIFFFFLVLMPFSFSEEVFKAEEKASPQDWLNDKNLFVYQDKLVIKMDVSRWVKPVNTNSMDPLLDESADLIEIKPKSPEEIKVGDIISFSSPLGNLIHRVVEIGYDQKGIFYITKGDNNPSKDPFKVRFEDIKGLVVVIIY